MCEPLPARANPAHAACCQSLRAQVFIPSPTEVASSVTKCVSMFSYVVRDGKNISAAARHGPVPARHTCCEPRNLVPVGT